MIHEIKINSMSKGGKVMLTEYIYAHPAWDRPLDEEGNPVTNFQVFFTKTHAGGYNVRIFHEQVVVERKDRKPAKFYVELVYFTTDKQDPLDAVDVSRQMYIAAVNPIRTLRTAQ